MYGSNYILSKPTIRLYICLCGPYLLFCPLYFWREHLRKKYFKTLTLCETTSSGFANILKKKSKRSSKMPSFIWHKIMIKNVIKLDPLPFKQIFKWQYLNACMKYQQLSRIIYFDNDQEKVLICQTHFVRNVALKMANCGLRSK